MMMCFVICLNRNIVLDPAVLNESLRTNDVTSTILIISQLHNRGTIINVKIFLIVPFDTENLFFYLKSCNFREISACINELFKNDLMDVTQSVTCSTILMLNLFRKNIGIPKIHCLLNFCDN